MSAMRYRVTSNRFYGTAEGDIISADGIRALGLEPERALKKGLVVEYDDVEPKKHKGARKDASDSDKD